MLRPIDPHQTQWEVLQPLETHFRPAKCSEVECPHWLMGWQTLIDEKTQFGQAQAGYIRHESARQFKEEHNEAGLTVFIFEAGQKCFRQHKQLLERPAVFRKNGSIMDGEDWIYDQKEQLYRLKTLRDRG